jgi:hypothetical protein
MSLMHGLGPCSTPRELAADAPGGERACCLGAPGIGNLRELEMSKIRKEKPSSSSGEYRSDSTPSVFFPAAIGVPNEDFKFSDLQYEQMEKAGGVKFTDQQRASLLTLANAWIGDLRLRLTARPKQFRECLEKMEKAFTRAEEACQWDHGLEYHLVHWAMETPVKNAVVFPTALAALELQLQTVRETVLGLIQSLPRDPGRQRPFDDERRIIFLADIFENAGGNAVAYAGGYYAEGSMADTPFRRFAQQFYSLLPAEDKRDLGGLDDPLRDAMAVRRAQRAVPP